MTRALLALLLVPLTIGCGSDTEAPADGSFGATCSADADCTAGRCFDFNSKGKRCTLTCPSDPAQCPNEGAGCNDKGVCKVE